MRKILVFLLLLLIACSMVACSSEPNDSNPPSEGIQQESNSDAQSSEPQNEKGDTEDTEPEQPLVELAKVDLFIEEYNKTATTPITDISEIDVTDQTSGHYRTEFRLGAFEDAYAKTGLIGDITVDIVGYGWDKEDIRIYADGISLEQAKEIIKVVSPILDTTLSESDIQDVMTYLDENQEACKNRHPSPICTRFEHHFHVLKPHLHRRSFSDTLPENQRHLIALKRHPLWHMQKLCQLSQPAELRSTFFRNRNAVLCQDVLQLSNPLALSLEFFLSCVKVFHRLTLHLVVAGPFQF